MYLLLSYAIPMHSIRPFHHFSYLATNSSGGTMQITEVDHIRRTINVWGRMVRSDTHVPHKNAKVARSLSY
jgi:hypothetical protein